MIAISLGLEAGGEFIAMMQEQEDWARGGREWREVDGGNLYARGVSSPGDLQHVLIIIIDLGAWCIVNHLIKTEDINECSLRRDNCFDRISVY